MLETEGPQHDSTIYRILQNLAGLESEYPPRRDRDRVVGLRLRPVRSPSYYEVPEAADLDLAGQLALLKLGLDRLGDLLNNLSGLLLRKRAVEAVIDALVISAVTVFTGPALLVLTIRPT